VSGYLEVSIVGGHSAFIDAGLVRGVVPHKDLKPWDVAPPGKPIQLFVGDNRELNVFGVSALELLVMCDRVRKRAKGTENVTIVPRDDYEVNVAPAPGGFDIQIRMTAGA